MIMSDYVEKIDMSKTTTLLWKGRPSILQHLDIELTERCNNNCIHCYISLPANEILAKKKELTTAEIKRILKEAASLGCTEVRFTGGEPLLREDFEEIYLFTRRLGIKVILFTNATLITPRLAKLFSYIPPLEPIEVTLYGTKENSYEAVSRTQGSYRAALNGIKLLLKKNIPFIIKGVIFKHNIDEIEDFDIWAKNILWMKRPPSYVLFFDLHCRRNKDRSQVIKKLRITPEDGLMILTRRKNEYINEMKRFCSRFIGESCDRLFSCNAGVGNGCVDAYGYFQLCMLLRHRDTVYNLKKGTLKNALKKFFPEIREMRATNPEYLMRCAKCFLKGLCEQCPAKSWLEHGMLDVPVEYYCNIAHIQAEFLGLISKNEKGWSVKNWKERIDRFIQD